MEALREKAKEFLASEHDRAAQEVRKKKLWGMLAEKYPFDVPSSLLQSEQKRLVSNAVEQLKAAQSDESIMGKGNEIEATALVQATDNLRRFFLARKLVADADLQPTEEETRQVAAELVMSDPAARSASETQFKELWQAYQNQAFIQLVQQKAEGLLLDN